MAITGFSARDNLTQMCRSRTAREDEREVASTTEVSRWDMHVYDLIGHDQLC